ncbi:DUF4271 domain-containing protein [Polaribacter sp. IC073]|uniref:DUF4271 domain-containing protein n=1 Tax=Polaribacter sp. IC073 TaxID=2508540 RepID=UPI0011BE9057|nr:DUF4271 domain-containing protein [Polaribacter sp. IC073]TXD49883.1 DUF4271 domain-containing protein [Polaribacter sp. IC073]
MQALEKIAVNTNWIPIVLVFLFAIIAVLKVLDAEKLKGYVFALFNRGFIEDEVEEDTSFFSFFYSLLFVFSSTVLALCLSLLISEKKADYSLDFSSFSTILGVVFGYFIVKSLLEVALMKLFLIKKQVRFYIVSKFSYLYSISFFLLIFFVIFQFSPLNASTFRYIAFGLFFLRFVFHLGNNKNLIFSELFYFILYICAFEIAPLITLFKLML